MIKKYLLLLLFFISLLGYSQVGTLDANGARTVTITQPETIVITGSSSDATGFGLNNGTITLDPITGGTLDLNSNYSITCINVNTGAPASLTGLAYGIYRVTVTDSKGCFKWKDFTINQPPVLSVNISGNANIPCFGGTGSLIANTNGGIMTTGYSYVWFKKEGAIYNIVPNKTNANPTGLPMGIYRVSVSDNAIPTNTTTSNDILLGEQPEIKCTPTPTHVKCRGDETGAIALNITGGTGEYTITWADNASITTATRNDLRAGSYYFTITDANGCGYSNNPTEVIIKQPSDVLSIAVNNQFQPSAPSNNNGAIVITASGGTAPYTYVWKKDNIFFSNAKDISGLINGIYQVTATDVNNCSRTSNPIELKALSVDLSKISSIHCNGAAAGSLEAVSSGGTLNNGDAYAYQWYNIVNETEYILTGQTKATITGLMAGKYRVKTKDSMNAEVTAEYILTEPTAITVVFSITNVNCFGGNDGTASISVSGGTPNNGTYTYEWSKGGIPLPAITTAANTSLTEGNYKVIVRDMYCSKEVSFTISQPINAIAIPTPVITEITIFGQSTSEIKIDMPTGGNGNYSYKWTSSTDLSFLAKTTKDISGLKAGFYTLEIRDSKAGATISNQGCIATKTVEVSQADELKVTLEETKSIDCFGNANGEITANVEGGILNYHYEWYKDDILIAGTTNILKNIGFGIYKVTVTDAPGAQKTSEIFDLKQPDKLKVTLIDQTDVLCFGENTAKINIQIEGGTKPYTIQWQKNNANYSTQEDLTLLGAGIYTILVVDGKGCTATLINPVTITQPNAALLITDVEVKNLSGFNTKNGSIEVAISGGTPTYTYAWRIKGISSIIGNSTILDELASGTYELTVTDSHNCGKTKEYTLTQPDKLEIANATQTQFIKCSGDKTASITAVVMGGVLPYTYKWYNVLTPSVVESTTATAPNLGAGSYKLEISDINNNTTFVLTDISQPEPLSVTYTQTNVSCHNGTDGTIDLSITGGTGAYSIVWSFNNTINKDKIAIKDLGFGEYTAIITDVNQCSTSRIITIKEPQNALDFASENKVNVSGFGLNNGEITVAVNGGTPNYNYKWYANGQEIVGQNNAILDKLYAGSYKLIVTDSKGCTIDKTFIISEPLELKVTVSITKDIDCFGGLGTIKVTAKVGTGVPNAQGFFTYQWYDKNNTLLSTITAADASSGTIPTGEYYVVVTDANNNQTTSNRIDLKQPSAIMVAVALKQNVSCFNGEDGVLHINVGGGTPDLSSGAEPYTYLWSNGSTIKDQSGLKAGTYAVQVFDGNTCLGTLNNIIITQPEDFGFDLNKIVPTLPTAINATDGALHIEIIGGIAPYTYVCKDSNGAVVETKTDSQSKQVDFVSLTTDNYYISVTDATGCTKSTAFDFNNNVLTVSLTQATPITCNNGTNANLDAAISGGFGVKTISWYKNNIEIANETDVQLTNVGAGTYYAIVKDFNKVEVTSTPIIITQPDAIVVAASQKEVSCLNGNDGAIYLTASGGSGVYQYRYKSQGSVYGNWILFTDATAILSNLKALSYDVQVQDSKGCNYTTSLNRSILEPTQLSINKTTITPTTGFGLSNGTIAITTQGGNDGYSYKWFDKTNAELNQITATITNLLAGQYYVIITDAKGCQITSELFEVTQPDKLITSINKGNSVLCNGDTNASLKANAIGGISGYTYQWFAVNNATQLGTGATLTGIGAGTYFVIATDSKNNVAQSDPFNVSEPAILNNTLTSDYTLCGDANDWTIATTPSGGTAPYTYLWNTGAKTASLKNVPPAKYTVLLTDFNGCSITKEILITAPIHLAAVEVIKIPTCYAGADATITVTASGGKAPYVYLWNTGEKSNVLSNASAGEYTLKVADSKGCIINHTYTIANPPKDVVNIGEDMTLCIGQSVTINATINDNKATYLWKSDKGFTSDKPIITISEAATYELVVTNKLGCQASDAIKISYQDIAIDAVFAISSQVFVNEKFVIVDISNPKADSIEWILPAAATVVSKNKDFAELSFEKAGEYEITLVTKKGDCSASQTKKVLVVEGEYKDPDSTDLQKKFDIKIYPNPSNGIFSVDVTLDKMMPAHVKVYNLINNAIVDSKVENGKEAYTFNFYLNGLTAGVYFILFESQQGNILRKIIIQ
jgi:hypothetical protein